MLRDITTTSAKVNSAIIPCIQHKHNKPQNSKSDEKRVQFDADGMTPTGDVDGSYGGREKAAEASDSDWGEYAEEEEAGESGDWE